MNAQYDEFKAEWTALAKTFGLEVVRIEAVDTFDYDGDPVTRIMFVLDDDTKWEEPVFEAMRSFLRTFNDSFFSHFPDKYPLPDFVTDRDLMEAEEEDEEEMEEAPKPPAA